MDAITNIKNIQFKSSKKYNPGIYINSAICRKGEMKMPIIEERKSVSKGVIQNLILENRGKLSVSGVLDVLSFDDQVVMIETELGLLTVKVQNLRINKLSIDTSEVIVEGEISYLAYSEATQNKSSVGLLVKIFK